MSSGGTTSRTPMRAWWVAAALVAVAALTLVAQHRPGHQSRARVLCSRAFDRHRVTSATNTTVGDVRTWRIGPGLTPGKGAFREQRDGADAAWCWVEARPGHYVAAAVDSAGHSVVFQEGNHAGHGPPDAP